MPTYDYVCDACGHSFEEFQSMKDDPLKKCPACKKNKLRRLFGGGAAILFKGSGFYQTDYRSEGYKSAAQADQNVSSKNTDSKGTSGTSSANGASGAESSSSASPGKGSGESKK